MNRIRIKDDEIEIGKPLPWAVFDPQDNRVAAAGDVIQTREHRQLLLSIGACREQEPAPVEPGEADEAEDPGGEVPKDTYPFDAMKLKIGDRLQIQLPSRLSEDRVVVRLIGYINNLSLLIMPPRDAKGFRLQLVENEKLVVRVFTSQNAFGFSATIIKVVKFPFEYLHLSFPAEVNGMVIRKAPRIKTKIICAVTAQQSGDESLAGMLVNLSAHGALLDSRRAIGKKGDTIKLAFRVTLHAIDALLNITAVVRAQFTDDAPANGRNNFVHHGLEFVDLQTNDTLILQSMIYQQMIEQPHSVM